MDSCRPPVDRASSDLQEGQTNGGATGKAEGKKSARFKARGLFLYLTMELSAAEHSLEYLNIIENKIWQKIQ